jgi:hypothetical protein
LGAAVKLDFKKEYREFYSPPEGQVQLIEVPPLQFLNVEGSGEPGGRDFTYAVAALYGLAFTIQMERKKTGSQPDYTLGPLECLWWVDGEIDQSRREDWQWVVMLWQPDFINQEQLWQAAGELRQKHFNPKISDAVLQTYAEGLSLQIMHIGPYGTEKKSIKKLQYYAAEHLMAFIGCHHEIYIGDPRQSNPESLKTILRHPVRLA